MNPGRMIAPKIEAGIRYLYEKSLSPIPLNTQIKDAEYREIIDSINNIKKEWKSAVNNFEFADSSELVDYYTYKIKACEIMYECLIKKAKEMGITQNVPNITTCSN